MPAAAAQAKDITLTGHVWQPVSSGSCRAAVRVQVPAVEGQDLQHGRQRDLLRLEYEAQTRVSLRASLARKASSRLTSHRLTMDISSKNIGLHCG
jgi:hypothetical protein